MTLPSSRRRCVSWPGISWGKTDALHPVCAYSVGQVARDGAKIPCDARRSPTRGIHAVRFRGVVPTDARGVGDTHTARGAVRGRATVERLVVQPTAADQFILTLAFPSTTGRRLSTTPFHQKFVFVARTALSSRRKPFRTYQL